MNKHPEIEEALKQAGIEIPNCPQCGDPMTIVRMREENSFDSHFVSVDFECDKIPIRAGHQYSMYDPNTCVRCGQKKWWLLPCRQDGS